MLKRVPGVVAVLLVVLPVSGFTQAPGDQIWAFPTTSAVTTSPALGTDGTIYIGCINGGVFAVHPDGTEKWSYQAGEGRITGLGIGNDGTIYAVGSVGIEPTARLYAIHPDGTLDWFLDVGVPNQGPSLAIGADGTLYVGGIGTLHVVRSDGAEEWSIDTAGFMYAVPCVGPDGTIYVTTDQMFYALNPGGEQLWTVAPTRPQPFWFSRGCAVGADGTIYFAEYNVVHALEPDGTLRWTQELHSGGVRGQPSLAEDGTIYVSAAWSPNQPSQGLMALNPDGSLKWVRTFSKPGQYSQYTPLVGSDGSIMGMIWGASSIYAIAEYAFSVNPVDGSVRWRQHFHTDQSSSSHVGASAALGDDGTLYVAGRINGLYAFHSGTEGVAESPWPTDGQNMRRTGRRRPVDMPPVELELGVPFSSPLPAGELHHFTVNTEAGRNLLVELVTSGGIQTAVLDAGYDGRPAPGAGHWSTIAATPGGGLELLLSPTQDGACAVTVLAAAVTGSEGSYTVTARYAETHLSDLAPRTGGNAGSVTAKVRGLGFVGGTTIELDIGGSLIAASDVTVDSSTDLLARFNLSGAPPGVYDVVARWPGGTEETLPGAFTVTPGIGPQLETSLDVPEVLRAGREYVFYLEYENSGDTDLSAPLLVVTSPQNVLMRLSPLDPYTRDGLQVLGISHGHTAGILGPGERYRVPVYFVSPFVTSAVFEVERVEADATAIDWPAVEAEIRSPGMSDELWSAVWSNFTTTVGATWADYVGTLGEMATYQGRHGRHTHDAEVLFGALFARAAGSYLSETLDAAIDAFAPARGLPLVFARVAPGGLGPRFTAGPLGRGWAHGYDYRLEQSATDRVMIHLPGGSARRFFLEDGAWRGGAGEYAVLSDTGGGVFTLVEPSGVALHFDGSGKLAVIDEPNGAGVSLGYDGDRLETATHTNGQVLTLDYNADDRIEYLTDHAGRVTEYVYDPSGEVLESVIAAGGVTTNYAYRPDSGDARAFALETITHPDGTHTYFDYDSEGRLSATHLDGAEETVTLGYDHLGTVTATDGLGHERTLRIGARGEILELQNPLGERHLFEYDERLDLRRIEQPDGTAALLNYDTRGNPIVMASPGHRAVRLASTAIPVRLDWFSDALDQTLDFEYVGGNLVAVTYPDESVESFTYDPANGDLETATNRRDAAVTFDHNELGELTDVDHPDGTWVDLGHDEVERSWTYTDAAGTTTIDYDERGMLETVTDAAGRTMTSTVNDAGRRTRMETGDGYELDYGYDAAGRLETITDGSGFEIVRYVWDDAGRLEREDRGNGTYTTYTYDAADRLLSLTHHAPGGAVQSFFAYTYDSVGNPVTLTTADGVTEFDYDGDGQLVTIARPDASEVVFTYDAAGNRELVSDGGAETVYEANELNQYTEVGGTILTFDDDGNLETVTDGGGTATLEWNAASRLQGLDSLTTGSWSFRDDAAGNRVEVVGNGVGRHFLHDPRGLGDVIAEYDDGGALAARYIHGLGLVARRDAAGNYTWYGFDGTGNTCQLTDASGTVVNNYYYSPFGVPTSTVESVPNPFRYGGRDGVMDDGHGLLYMRARYYEPAAGRFVSPDPIGLAGGSNLYAYAANSPIRWIDPIGLKLARPSPLVFTSALDAIEARDEFGESINGIRASGTPQEIQESLTRNHTARKNFVHESLTFVWHVAIELYKNFATFGAGSVGSTIGNAGGHLAHQAIKRKDLLHHGVVPGPDVASPRDTLPSQSSSSGSTRVITSHDPNEKAGPAGLGPSQVVRAGQELDYTVYFENLPTATAAAQEIFVSDCLDRNLDWTTLEVDEVVFGDHTVTNAGGGAVFTQRVTVADLREDNDSTWWVDVSSTIDLSTGCLDVSLEMRDPETGELPMDVFAGFLPPDDGEGSGQGHFNYSVEVKEGLDDGRLVRNRASIVFDTNDALWTNEVINTVGPQLYSLTVSLAGDGAGAVTSDPSGIDCGEACVGWFAEAATVELTATPAHASAFVGWSGDPDCEDGEVTLTADTACNATFSDDSAVFADGFEEGDTASWSARVPPL